MDLRVGGSSPLAHPGCEPLSVFDSGSFLLSTEPFAATVKWSFCHQVFSVSCSGNALKCPRLHRVGVRMGRTVMRSVSVAASHSRRRVLCRSAFCPAHFSTSRPIRPRRGRGDSRQVHSALPGGASRRSARRLVARRCTFCESRWPFDFPFRGENCDPVGGGAIAA